MVSEVVFLCYTKPVYVGNIFNCPFWGDIVVSQGDHPNEVNWDHILLQTTIKVGSMTHGAKKNLTAIPFYRNSI